MPNNPVQVVLNTKDYFRVPDPGKPPRSKDFFANRDREFVEHRERLLRQVTAVGTVFQRSGMPSTGVLKVSLRREAWAKSHRPQRAVFPPAKRPCIAASKLGDLYYYVTADDVQEIAHEISAAESETRKRISKRGKEYFAPSDQRSDVGTIESIELPSVSEKRKFSADEAVRWLSDPRTSSAYFVEFYSLPPRLIPQFAGEFIERRLQSVVNAAQSHELTVQTFPVDLKRKKTSDPTNIVGVRLASATDGVFLPSVEEHAKLLAILDSDPYVRHVLLPPIVMAAKLSASVMESTPSCPVPPRASGVAYPKIGVIDGGFGSNFQSWSLGAHTIIAPEHQQTDHGSFIAGLVVGGQALNGSSVCAEMDGCDLFDIGILPDPVQQDVFEIYYPNGVVDFLAEVDSGVEVARRNFGVRVFNMSLNLQDPVQNDGYGVVASLLDQIADKHDVIFVLSAGNLEPSDCRDEWSANPQTALQYLASRTVPETVLQPAESSRSIAVGALNPPGCGNRVAGVPAAYTRRGPGLRVGVKPDVGHFGGALAEAGLSSGLRSWIDDSQVVMGHGTSYATPLVAKPLATLESRIVSPLSREMLQGLLIHGCQIPETLRSPTLAEVARQFIGFGVPSPCEEMLQTPDHAITLVFSDVLFAKRKLEFNFAWPRSLVNQKTGACRGEVRMTLVYRPTLNAAFGCEVVRVNLDAHLQQEEGDGYESRIKQAFLPKDKDDAHFEHELIRHGLKWWPIKVYHDRFPRGKGKSSNWRLSLDSLLRADEVFPAEGVPFALVLTISDIDKTEPVFNDLRLHLTSSSVQISDIRAATQVRVQS
jgi:Subtilase family